MRTEPKHEGWKQESLEEYASDHIPAFRAVSGLRLPEELGEDPISSSLHALPDYTNPETMKNGTRH